MKQVTLVLKCFDGSEKIIVVDSEHAKRFIRKNKAFRIFSSIKRKR